MSFYSAIVNQLLLSRLFLILFIIAFWLESVKNFTVKFIIYMLINYREGEKDLIAVSVSLFSLRMY